MLLSHTPTGSAAPDLVFCGRLPPGQQHMPATRAGTASSCPHPCGATCPLQQGACVAPPPLPARLAVSLHLAQSLVQLLDAQGLGGPPAGCVVCRN